MSALDRILDQAQQALAAGDAHTAHNLTRAILADEPDNARAQSIFAHATNALSGTPTPPPRQSPFTPISIPAPAKKRASPLAFVLLTLVFLGAGWIFFSGATTPSRTTSGPGRSAPVSARRQIEYRVTGTASRVSLTYQNGSGGTEQKDVALPFNTSFTTASGSFLYLSAQNNGDRGTVICTISVDGAVFKTSTSDGAYKIAGCSGSAR